MCVMHWAITDVVEHSRGRGSQPQWIYANKHRDAKMAEELFWSLLSHLQSLSPGFGHSKGFRRFKRTINVVEALIANWIRRRKAAAKCHLRLDCKVFCPVLIDAKRAREVCAGLKE